jgi:hypothetical protein
MKSKIKVRRFQIILLVTALFGARHTYAVVEVTSPVWAASATTLQGNGGAGTKYTSFSQRTVRAILYAGTISAVQNNTLTDTNANWSNGQFGVNGVQSYVEFPNGWTADISDTSGGTKTLTLAGNITGIAAAGDGYQIRAHSTIASLFGTNNETGLKVGLNPAQADNILLQIPQTQQTMTIFYFSNATVHGWFRADFSPAANQIVYPEQGVLVKRVSSGDVNLYACGPVKVGATVAPIDPGFNLMGTLKSATTLTLGGLNLYSGNPATGIASGLNLSSSDNVLILKPDGSTASYFYFKNNQAEGWVDASFNPAGNTAFPPGTAFYIHRLNANGSFNWTIPAE